MSIIKSLGRIPGVDLWVADIDRHAAGLYLAPADRRLLLPRGDAAGFVDSVLDWCRNESIDVVFPTVDQELQPLAAARQAFEDAGVTLVLAAAATLAVCLDKWRLYEACRGHLPVPRTALLDQSSTLADWDLPCIVKPRTGSGSRDVRLVRSDADLAQVPHDGSYIIQEYLPGEEHSLDVLADRESRVLSVVPRIRLKLDSGVAVAGRTVHDQELESLGRTVAARVGLSWVGNVQTRRDAAGVARLLEVNPRFPGTMPLTVAAGVDMPAICLAMTQGRTASVPIEFREVAMIRFLDERFLQPEELLAIRARPERVLANAS